MFEMEKDKLTLYYPQISMSKFCMKMYQADSIPVSDHVLEATVCFNRSTYFTSSIRAMKVDILYSLSSWI